MISLFVRHPNAANLLMLLMLAGGLFALTSLNRQFFPTFGLDIITITVVWPGSSAADVEASVIERIEPPLRSVNGVKTVTATARDSYGVVVIEFHEGSNMQSALSDVEAAVGGVQDLPQDIEEPQIEHVVDHNEVSNLLVTGYVSEAALSAISQQIRNDLLALGLSRVSYEGRRSQELHVEIDQDTLLRLNLTLDEISAQIRAGSLDQPLGDFGRSTSGQARVESRGEYASDLAELIVVPDPTGEGVRLGDIAVISNDFDEDEAIFWSGEGKRRAVKLKVEIPQNTDTIAAARVLQGYLDEKAGTWPASVEVVQLDQRADLIIERIDLLVRNGLGGLVLVLLLLAVFLNLRTTFWIALGIPVALFATMLAMLALGQSINMLSLFGLIMSLGIVVDDAIVVGEHASFLKEKGMETQLAAEQGALRMVTPVMAASLTTVATFAPLFMIGGVIGQIIGAVPQVVVAVIVASVIECFLILPSHMRDAMHSQAATSPGRWRVRFEQLFARVRDVQLRKLILFCARWRYATVCAVIGLLILSLGLVSGGRVEIIFFQPPESETLFANFNFAPGTPPETTAEMLFRGAQALRKAATRWPEEDLIRHITLERQEGGHRGTIQVELTPSDARSVRNNTLVQAWEEEINPLAGLEEFTLREHSAGPVGRDIDIRFSGASSEVLKQVALETTELLESFVGVSAIQDDLLYGKLETVMTVNARGRSLGFTNQQLADQVRHALEGLVSYRFVRGEDEVKVRIRFSDADRGDGALSSIRLRSPQGGEVSLLDVVEISRQQGFSTIVRGNGKREVSLTADVDEAVANPGSIRNNLPAAGLEQITQRHGVSYRFAGRAEERADTFSDMRRGGVVGLVAVYLILAWALSSYTRPLLVMAIIPFGLMGAIFGHWVMGFALTIISFMALLGLAGILVNDSIILVTAIDNHIKAGRSPLDAVLEGTRERLRPVLLTSLTTIGALLPMLFETSYQAQFLLPMVISLIFGLSTAFLLVLILVPCLFLIQDDTRLGLAKVSEFWSGSAHQGTAV